MEFMLTRDSYLRENLNNGYGRQLRDLLNERSAKLENPTYVEKLELLRQAIRDIEEVKVQKVRIMTTARVHFRFNYILILIY